VTPALGADRADGWFHAGGGGVPSDGGEPLLPSAAEVRRRILSDLLGQRRAEAEALRRRQDSLRRQMLELDRAREDLVVSPPTAAPVGEEDEGALFWSPVPILGFRLWRLTSRGVHGVVRAWPGPRLEAHCPRGPGAPHDAPGCRCGIYALKDPGALWALRPGAGPILVYGLVALSGKVVEHAYGYRSRRAEVMAVVVLRNGAMLCRSDLAWIARLFVPGLGLSQVEDAGGVRAIGPGLPVGGVEYLEDEARRFRESWT